jgi:hypothetical protein
MYKVKISNTVIDSSIRTVTVRNCSFTHRDARPRPRHQSFFLIYLIHIPVTFLYTLWLPPILNETNNSFLSANSVLILPVFLSTFYPSNASTVRTPFVKNISSSLPTAVPNMTRASITGSLQTVGASAYFIVMANLPQVHFAIHLLLFVLDKTRTFEWTSISPRIVQS